MPWVVGSIGLISFLAGVAICSSRWVLAGFLIALASALALWLRGYVESSIDQAFEKGAGYGISTRRRIRDLPEAHQVSATVKALFLDS